MRILIHTISLVRRKYTYIELSGTSVSDIDIQPARIQFESCLHLSLTLLCVVFYRPALSMQYQIDKISTIKLCPLPIFLVFTCTADIFGIYMQKMRNCKQCIVEPELPNKACFKRRILHASNSIVSIMFMLSATSETITVKPDVLLRATLQYCDAMLQY